ncbi:hypothetical protein [Novosphingobium sp. CCH12-A3]|uniref:hypothetical protein n=1 Tax=Novosphingobium sp. CCH12-A3 TaxID=1768752 RepID=UPI000782A6CF|nr:hypothetical protein [Novosphingobium sp. CCH12-A3]
MQWSSVVIGYGGSHVAFIDVEQANALSFLLSRSVWLEQPVFSYIEFMIRAAETFYDDGDIALSASISERANERLWAYCRHHETEDSVYRPMMIDELLPQLLDARVILGFITGHEIGHLAQLSNETGTKELFDWVEAHYMASHLNLRDPEMPFERFLDIEIVQKISEDGSPAGYAIQTSKYARQMLHMRRQQLQETQSDALGVILATPLAIEAEISAAELFSLFPRLIEHTEMLMMLRRIVTRLPRGERLAAIASERSSQFARLTLFVRLIRGLQRGQVDAPRDVLDYWASLPENLIAGMEAKIESGQLEMFCLRNAVLCRGSIEVGLCGKLAPPLSQEYRKLLGVFGGNLSVAYAHGDLPEEMFRIEKSYDWEPSEAATDALSLGFAGAITDIAQICATETREVGVLRRKDILREASDDQFIAFLRSARRQTFERILDAWWAGFEDALRKPWPEKGRGNRSA